MPVSRRAPRWLSYLCVVLSVGGIGLVGCGEDDPAASAAQCDAYIGATKEFNADEPDPEALAGYFDDLEADLPADVDSELQFLIDTARVVLEEGDDTAFLEPDVIAAQAKVDPFFFESCDADDRIDVTAIDYAFQKMPDSIEAGEIAFLFTNNSEAGEFHEMALARKNDGVTESFDEILELEESEADGKVTFAAGTGAAPDGVSATWVELEAGDYIMICFVPQGAGPDNPEAEGPPHFTLGMKREFTVK